MGATHIGDNHNLARVFIFLILTKELLLASKD